MLNNWNRGRIRDEGSSVIRENSGKVLNIYKTEQTSFGITKFFIQ